ncbi:MAG: hypothetical protein J3Q66DRAFT_15984 [Benniella sp.]|nr:MAG: hypothetical protein J3Q66DRAFT_15984 [Benniella sp.]
MVPFVVFLFAFLTFTFTSPIRFYLTLHLTPPLSSRVCLLTCPPHTAFLCPFLSFVFPLVLTLSLCLSATPPLTLTLALAQASVCALFILPGHLTTPPPGTCPAKTRVRIDHHTPLTSLRRQIETPSSHVFGKHTAACIARQPRSRCHCRSPSKGVHREQHRTKQTGGHST